MNNEKKSKTVRSAGLSLAVLCICLQLPQAKALPDGQQIIKYLNPVHEKSYTNEKQDRLIKKKAFKGKEIAGVKAIANKDIGLFASLKPEQWQDSSLINHLLALETVNGLSCLLPWRTLQPQEDKFDWTIVDGLLATCEKHNKQLILRIATCGTEKVPGQGEAHSDTPDWVFAAGAKSIPYMGKDGKTHTMPIFWDGTYLAKWSNFVSELGKRYDKSPGLQSIGITGGGLLGGTNVVPEFTGDKDAKASVTETLQTKYEMSPRQLVNHWKYVADIFPRAFQKQHLNFDLDPPTADRKGQDCLDEIGDYLVYRYGQRVYLSRQNVKDGRHGFDQYRLVLKYKNDTLIGYEITPALFVENEKADLSQTLAKVAKNAFDDGLSYAEIPAAIFDSDNAAIKDWLNQMRLHLGYQLILTDFTASTTLASGKPLHIAFAFINNGAASPKRPLREMDKDVPASYKIQVSVKNAEGKTLALLRHTPPTSTVDWLGVKPISWEQDLKMPLLKPGKYNLALDIIDEQSHKLNFLADLPGKTTEAGAGVTLANLEITQ